MNLKARVVVFVLGMLLITLMAFPDGSDPMPLCRAKGCGPIKGKVIELPLPGENVVPLSYLQTTLRDGGPLPMCPPHCMKTVYDTCQCHLQ